MVQTTSEPFFIRWAQYQAMVADQTSGQRRKDFDDSYTRICQSAAALSGYAARGQDWTKLVASLREQVAASQRLYGGRFPDDNIREAKSARLDTLAAALTQPLSATLTSVTVRLAASVMIEQADVLLEIMTDDGQTSFRTASFPVGPAAPAGTGWVGTHDLNITLPIKHDQPVWVIVRAAGSGEELLRVVYEASGENMLPGSLMRPRFGSRVGVAGESATPGEDAGSVVLKVADGFWRQLRVPYMRIGAM
jgi:hypothetical protein